MRVVCLEKAGFVRHEQYPLLLSIAVQQCAVSMSAMLLSIFRAWSSKMWRSSWNSTSGWARPRAAPTRMECEKSYAATIRSPWPGWDVVGFSELCWKRRGWQEMISLCNNR